MIKLIEAHYRSYLWSGTNNITERALVAWDKVYTPKSIGGLNLINIKLWNKAAIAKITWDLASKKDKLWIRWIHNYYIKANTIYTTNMLGPTFWYVGLIMSQEPCCDSLENSEIMC